MKRIFYILILIAGFHLSSNAQVKPTYINDDVTTAVKFYPNPASSLINFEFKTYNKANTLLIYNFIGKKVIEVKANEQKITVPLTDFYRGVYIFQLRDAQGTVLESGKFQVVK